MTYAAVMPGSVLEQGEANRVTGKQEIYDVVHLTFFSEEKTPGGATWHFFAR